VEQPNRSEHFAIQHGKRCTRYQIVSCHGKDGKNTYIEPSQAVMKRSSVYHLIANVETDWTAEKIREEIANIDELTHC
jgi:hypothetical protein